jgi:hypothetical protein
MPRYLIDRSWDPDKENKESIEAGVRSKRVAKEKFPEIVWEHSHVVMDERGLLKSFCIYQAPNPEMVREHAKFLGNHVIEEIYEIGGDIEPAGFSD